MDTSARSLGESEDETETDANKLKEKQANHARWEARGAEIKAQMREELLFSFMPDHEKAMYVYLHGWPGKEKREPAKPLEGVSQSVAKRIVALLVAKRFTYGEWAKSYLWTQLRKGDARARLEKTAEGEG